MARTDYPSVDAYLADQPEPVRAVLAEVRAIVRETVPEAAEVMSYQVPAYRLHGGFVCYLSGFKSHYSLSFPPPTALFETFATQLAANVKGKAAVRFPLDEPVPADLIRDLCRFRALELEARAAANPRRR
ncbi:MAG: DUF1801 domain-containing protein [Dehalococcoidia bacterium]